MPDPYENLPKKLVVIDDAPTVLRVMDSVLGQAGYHVTCVERGADALATIRRVLPDLLFLDATLPDMGAETLCKQIDDDPLLARMPIVLLTTRADAAFERLASSPSVVDHITKPFAPEALLALVEHLLRKSDVSSDPTPIPSLPAERRDTKDLIGEPSPLRRLTSAVAVALQVSDDGETSIADRLAAAFTDADIVTEMAALLRERQDAPALTGDLARVPIADVLQMLSLQRQTGILAAQRGHAVISIAFQSGTVRLVIAENAGREFLLGNILIRERLIESHELALVLQNRTGTRRRLGKQVVQLGYVSAEDLRRALRRQSSELVYELLRWRTGRFEYQRHDRLPDDLLEFDLGVSVEELLMEGFRRVDEWGLIETVLPSFDVILVRVPGGIEHVGPLTPEEQAVFDRVDGRRRVEDLIEQAGASAFDVARVLYRLISTRALAVAAPQNVSSPRGP